MGEVIEIVVAIRVVRLALAAGRDVSVCVCNARSILYRSPSMGKGEKVA